MKVRPLYIFLILLLVFIALEQVYARFILSAERSAYLMGSPVRVKVQGPDSPRLARRALREIKRLDRLFSRFKPDSEVSLINKLAGRAPVEVSADTFDCLRLAEIINRLSQGAFDITLGSPRALVLDHDQGKIFLKRAGIRLNLGGIGKGYAAESARRLLLKKGAQSGMIDMRSSIAVFGPRTWRIGIQHPRQRDKLIGTVRLRDGQSLSTSGDYERGKHIVDPRSGRPAEGCQSVTVVGRNAAETDALSTAVFVLGPVQGLRLIESLAGVEALIIDQQGRLSRSAGFILDSQ